MKRESKFIGIGAVLLFLVNFILTPETDMKMSWGIYGFLMAALVLVGIVAYIKGKNLELIGDSLMTAAILTVIQATCKLKTRGYDNISVETIQKCSLLLTIGLLVGILLLLGRRAIGEREIYWAIGAAVLLRFFYAVMTQGHYFQNDIGFFGQESTGHLGYIYHFFTTGQLPAVNPMENGQFYHPPLHHALSALLIKVYEILGLDAASGDEYMQMLAVFYGLVTLVFLDKIAKQLKLSCKGRFIAIVLAGFFPYGIMLNVALNNDPLVTMLMIMALYYTLQWYEKPTYPTILAMAVCIGCAMMTKLSAALITPAIAVLMLAKAWQQRDRWKTMLGQFACFGCVVFPLGMWHPVLMRVKWGVPFGYVLQLPLDISQSLVDFTTWDRFFNFQGVFDSLIVSWNRFGDYIEYNIWMALWKFAAYGETFFYDITPAIKVPSLIVFAAVGLVFLFLIAGSVWFLVSKKEKWENKVLILVSMAIIMVMYLKFCIDYPFVCTMNVRYIMVIIFLGCILMAKLIIGIEEKLKSKKVCAGIYRAVISIGLLVYVLSVVMMYWNLEMLVY